MRKLHFFRDYLAEKFGKPLQKIPFDLGFSCPNRAPDGSGGCTFCAPDGGRARHLTPGMTLREQAARGKKYVLDRYGSEGPYIAYFQAFTGTNAPPETLRKTYADALALADFPVVAIGTRPDCLPDKCLDYLAEFNRTREVWVELGIQTSCGKTLKRIQRGHSFAVSADAAKRLAARGISAAAHLILGLPGEGPDEWRTTAREIAALPFSGVKIHPLLVLKGTALAAEFTAHPFPVLREYEYAEALADFLEILPEGMLIQRLTAEAEAEEIIAPQWWMKKGQFLEMFRSRFEYSGNPSRFTPRCTDDGSWTLYHPLYKQHFHSLAGAILESEKKYLEPCSLEEKLKTRAFVRVLDVGFGLGCNAASTVRLAEKCRRGKLEILSLESDPRVIPAALSLPGQPAAKMLESLRDTSEYKTPFAHLRVIFGNAVKTLPALDPEEKFDAVFLDGFSPDTNPELWTREFIGLLAERLAPDGILAAYSSAYPVFGALLAAGLNVYRTKPFGRRRPGTAASFAPDLPLEKLSEKDRAITLDSTAGIPYRDPELSAARAGILAARKEEVARLRRAGMPKWISMPDHSRGKGARTK